MDSVENETEQDAFGAGIELEAQDTSDANESQDNPEPPVASAADQGEGVGGTDAAATSTGWQQELETAGFQQFEEVDDAVKALVESNRQRDDQIRQYAEQVRFYQDQAKYQQSQSPPPSQPAPAAETQEHSDPLSEILDGWEDPSWANQYIEVDAEGNRSIADHVDDQTRDKILDLDRKLRRHQESLNNPRLLADIIDKRVERLIQERFETSYEQKQSQQNEKQYVDSFISDNSSWLYRRDPATGAFMQDAITGEYLYSDNGSTFLRHMDAIAQDGVSDVTKQIQYARQMMGPAIQPQASPQESPQQQAEAQKRAMQGRTNDQRRTQSSFNGVTSSGSGVTGQNTMSFGEETLQAMLNGTE